MAYENLKNAITQVIKQNGNQEITGNLLQSTLLNIVNNIGADYKFLGFAKPSTVPPTSEEGRLFYFASKAGEYINFPTTGENTHIVTKEGLYLFTKEANSNYWKEEILIDITHGFGDDKNKVLSQEFSTMIAAAPSINNFSANLRLKSETGYITNTGNIDSQFGGITLSFTVNTGIVNTRELYLYGKGFADPKSDWATYAIYNSNNELKRVGPVTSDTVSKYKNCIVEINNSDLVVGDVIKVSIHKLKGNACLFYKDAFGFYQTVIPDNEEVHEYLRLSDITHGFGDAEDKVISQNLASIIAAAPSINNFSANLRLKSETGYITNTGSINPIKSGIVLSFTVDTDIVNTRELYLYGKGFADPNYDWATYAIYNSNNELKRVGPVTNDTVSICRNCITEINNSDLVVGDVIKVSVNRLKGTACLFLLDKFNLYRFLIPDNEEAPDDKLNQWKGKKIVWIGTSIPWGQTSESGQTNPMANPYPKQIGELLDCTVLNHAQPGMSIRYNKDGTVRYGQCLSLTVKELQEKGLATIPFKSYENAVLGFDADLYVFDSEPNNGSVPSDGDLELLESFSIKNWAYSDNSDFASHRNTFVGAFIYIYDKLLNEKPNAKVILVGEYGGTGIGGGNGREWETEYYNHTLNIAIAKKFNLPIFSLFELLGYNPKNVDIYMNADRVHPKYAAHIRMANILKEKLLEVF